MNLTRITYRTRQFWRYLGAAPSQSDIIKIYAILTPRQFALFSRMHKTEQFHSLEVLRGLVKAGETDRDLLVAALLHDSGKVLQTLRLWERVWVVLVKAFFPRKANSWGEAGEGSMNLHVNPSLQQSMLPWWKKPFLTARQHPAWGANLAEEAGASAASVALIRRHQENVVGPPVTQEDVLLRKLQDMDETN